MIVFFGLCNDVLAYPHFIASYTVSVRQYRILQSRFLQCILHSKPPCDLLRFRVVTPAHKGFTPSGKKITPISLRPKINLYFCDFYRALKWVWSAHAGHTHGFCVRRGDVQTWSFVLLFKFSAGWQFCAPKPARTQSPKTLWFLNVFSAFIKTHLLLSSASDYNIQFSQVLLKLLSSIFYQITLLLCNPVTLSLLI